MCKKYLSTSIHVEWFDLSTLYLYLIYYLIFTMVFMKDDNISSYFVMVVNGGICNSNHVIYKWKGRVAITVMTCEIVVYNIFGESSGRSMLNKCITLTGWLTGQDDELAPVNCMFFCYHPIKNNLLLRKGLRIHIWSPHFWGKLKVFLS